MIPRDFHYAWPGGFYLLFFPLIFAALMWFLFLYRQKTITAERLLCRPRSKLFFAIQSGSFLLSWTFAAIAVLQPVGNGHYPKDHGLEAVDASFRLPAHEVILLVDASASMSVADMRSGQTRLDFAKQLIDELVSQLDGESVSLYAFTSSLIPLSPPTLDYLFVRLMLKELVIDEEGVTGTGFSSTLQDLKGRLLEMPQDVLKTVIIFSDGEDTSIDMSLEIEKNSLRDALLKETLQIAKLNARVYTVGIGSLTGGQVPDVTYKGKPVYSKFEALWLKLIAHEGHGSLLYANDYSVIDGAEHLLKEIGNASLGAEKRDLYYSALKGEDLIYDHYFQIPLACAILAFLIALYLPETRGVVLAAFLFIGPLSANDIRPAKIYFEAYDYEKSLRDLKELEALQSSSWQQSTLLYNKGTAFLAEGKWDLAISTFNSALLFKELPSHLKENLNINLGIAYIKKAEELKKLKSPPFSIVVALQKLAMRAFGKAEEADFLNKDASHLKVRASKELALSQEVIRTHPASWIKEILANSLFLRDMKKRDQKKERVLEQKAFLEKIVEKQFFASMLLLQDLLNEEKGGDWKTSQELVVQIADQFIPKVLEGQIEQYRKEGLCQASPWDEVLPLFEKGRIAAKMAEDQIKKGNLQEALGKENEALAEWQKALIAMNAPRSLSSSCQGSKASSSEEKKEEKGKDAEPADLKGANGKNDILRTLQELNLDDRLPKSEVRVKKGGERAW